MLAVNSAAVSFCKSILKGSNVSVGAAVGFPLGQTTITAKLFETKDAIENGADEIDYVIKSAPILLKPLPGFGEWTARVGDVGMMKG